MTGLLFVLNICLARTMGASEYGVYIYVMSWVFILLMFSKMGWDTAIIRYGAAYKAKNQWSLFRGITVRADQVCIILSLTILTLTLVLINFFGQGWDENLKKTFRIGIFLIPLLALTILRSATLRSLQHIVLSALGDGYLKPMMFIASAAVIYLIWKKPLAASLAMMINVALSLGVLVVNVLILKVKIPPPLQISRPEYQTEEWMQVSIPLFFIAGMTFIINRLDILMIGVLIDTTQAGIYAAASRVAGLVTFGLAAINYVFVPVISDLYAKGLTHELQRMYTLALRGILIFSIPTATILILAGRYILRWFGTEFESGYYALVILSISQLINALAGPVDHLMTMTRYHNQAAIVFGGTALLNGFLNFWLIPFMGIEGAAVATGISLISWNLSLVFLIHRCMRLTLTIFPKNNP